jgi:hypothetical protein
MWLKLKELVVKAFKQPNVKNVTSTVLVLLVIPYLLYLGISKIYRSLKDKSLAVGSELTTAQLDLKVQQLKDAFTNLLDNYNDIKVVLIDLSSADYYNLKNHYGIVYRSYLTGGVATGLQANTFTAQPLDLNQWLSKELDASQLTQLKQELPNLPI